MAKTTRFTMAKLGLLALAAGCRGLPADRGQVFCDARALEEGEVRVRAIPCDDELISGGEGRSVDYLIENARARFLVHHSAVALTLLEVGGGTVIDAAPYGGEDVLAELVPLVDGGWLEPISMELRQGDGEASILLEGTPAPISFLEDQWQGDASATVQVVYRLAADDAALQVEGAQGFWLMPLADAELAGSTLRSAERVMGIDGEPEDFGGGVRFAGGSRFAVGDASLVHDALWPGGEEVWGQAEGDGVELLAGEELLGWLPVDDEGDFAGQLPAGADGLRTVRQGYQAGPVVVPGSDLDLSLGAAGFLKLRAADGEGQGLAAQVRASQADGQSQLHLVPPEGARLPLGPGTWDLAVCAGVLREREQLQGYQVQEDSELEVTLRSRAATEGWLLADLDVEAWPSRDDRRAASLALAEAAAAEVGFAVVMAPDEVAVAELRQPWERMLLAESGSRAQSDSAGTVAAWPWSSNERKAAHSAAAWKGLSAVDLAAVANGSSDRLLVAHMDWLRAAGDPLHWDPAPDLFSMTSLDDLAELQALADSWQPLALCGPLTWVAVEDRKRSANVEVEASLLQGRTVASSGPHVELLADGLGPGQRVYGRGPHLIQLQILAAPWMPISGAMLLADGQVLEYWELQGVEPLRLDVRRLATPQRYLVAVVWGETDPGPPARGEPWAVSSPIWFSSP